MIPARHGNDFVGSTMSGNLAGTVQTLCNYDSCEDYLARQSDANLRDNFHRVKSHYDLLSVPLKTTTDLPDCLVSRYKEGHFTTQLLGVYLNHISILGRVTEDISQECAWVISRGIQKFLYGFMGIPDGDEVKEIIRLEQSVEVPKEGVSVIAQNVQPPVDIHSIKLIDSKNLEGLVLCVLKFAKKRQYTEIFNQLDGKWKLPVVATYYWYKHCEAAKEKKYLVKSLLLSFLTCSQEIKDEAYSSKVNDATKNLHWDGLHAFAQWQCVYYDAMALNYLAKEPFESTNPYLLYSGRIVMFYASLVHENMTIESFIQKLDCNKYELYGNLLYLVTGDELAQKMPPKPKPKQQTPFFKDKNPFSPLDTK